MLQIIVHMRTPNSENHADIRRMRAVMPSFHGLSHYLKSLAAKFQVEIVFKNDYRLPRLTPFDGKGAACQKRYGDPVMPFQEGVGGGAG